MQNQIANRAVGVPKREPCQKCGNPVFLAERVTIDTRLFHRTCLKCARCGAQLSLGSFYETENDGEFCCETCPDEELKGATAMTDATDSTTSNAFTEKLAMFENNRLLQKSLSDEEKSQSLKRLGHMYQEERNKRSHFLTAHFTETENDSDADLPPPPLPSTRPPNTEEEKSVVPSKEDDKSDAESVVTSSDDEEEETASGFSSLHKDKESQSNSMSAGTNDTANEAAISSIQLICDRISDHTVKTKDVVIKDYDAVELDNNHQSEQTALATHSLKSSINIESSLPSSSPVTTATVTTTVAISLQNSYESDNDEQNDVTKDKEDTKNDDDDDDDVVLREVAQDVKIANPAPRSTIVRSRLMQFEQMSEASSTEQPTASPRRISRATEVKREVSEINISLESPAIAEMSSNVIESDATPIIATKKAIRTNEGIEETVKTKESIETTPNIVVEEIANENAVQTSSMNIECSNTIESSSQKEIIQEVENENKSIQIQELEPMPTTVCPDMSEEMDVVGEEQQISDNRLVSVVLNKTSENEDNSKIILQVVEKAVESPLTEVDGIKSHEISASKKDTSAIEYPDDLNPFQSEDEDDEEAQKENLRKIANKEKRMSLNPFDSSDDEIEAFKQKTLPPRPPPPKMISTNPFGSDSEDDNSSIVTSSPKRTPVPTPRKSLRPVHLTPEPTPRLSRQSKVAQDGEFHGSTMSLTSPSTLSSLNRNTELRGSDRSLASANASFGTMGRRKKKAPAPPPPISSTGTPSSLNVSQETLSLSPHATPRTLRKKRPAPLPPQSSTPKPMTTDANSGHTETMPQDSIPAEASNSIVTDDLISSSTTTNKANASESPTVEHISITESVTDEPSASPTASQNLAADQAATKRKLIPLELSLMSDYKNFSDRLPEEREDHQVTYRRTIYPLTPDHSTLTDDDSMTVTHDRQWEKMKDNKESQNRNRQSQIISADEYVFSNKSEHGKWKRRKGPAPSLPVPPRKILQMLPLQEIRHELEVIEVQQQGLEKQGVMLEKMIRERCEGEAAETQSNASGGSGNSKEVEDLIMQLFELVNEKNDLFRRQAELMYLRRQHRLEQEQADLEYEIRVLMAQPERNKTDSDKAREEALIARLVEVVQLRNDVIDCLEMDRIREAEEDQSIKQSLEMHTAKRDEELLQTPTKLSKKEKKKQKESKKLAKHKKMDADKDADESELHENVDKKEKKKKKKFLSLLTS